MKQEHGNDKSGQGFDKKILGITQLESAMLEFIHNHILHILSVCLLALSLIFRWHYRNYESIDYQTFLLPWYTHWRNKGEYRRLLYSLYVSHGVDHLFAGEPVVLDKNGVCSV